jgi:hypothetical protein
MRIPRSVVELPLRLEPVTPDPFAEPVFPAPRVGSFAVTARERTGPETEMKQCFESSARPPWQH